MAEFGTSTSARFPSRRTISIPSSVLPEPGGATMCVRRRPSRRSSSNAASASSWYWRHSPWNSSCNRLGLLPDEESDNGPLELREDRAAFSVSLFGWGAAPLGGELGAQQQGGRIEVKGVEEDERRSERA